MDEKIAALRDVFLEATGEETVRERGGDRRGSLLDVDDPAEVDARLRDLVASMRERYDFETDLDPDGYVRLIRGVLDGDDDETLAAALGVDAATVVRARLDCHLVREADRERSAFEAIREGIAAGEDDATVAAAVPDATVDDVAHVRRVVATQRAATRANGRFRDAFLELLTDADLADRLVRDAREDGLREATEDIETDVSF